ncbi:NAD-dependent epimerase/dehydratase family protein [Streptococcus sp. zg-86]|uniref:NAD-dependent epimerase/dehydratase family protein n=1 Tax=Streptococcus zhangguiae TaxID=2664091 RepID=A0A6I4RRL0_9STRE|nr:MULTISPECIES: nucleoside-diphosphate sugar epimerase/dehydratase [unclassified Streptococcus]MTB64722.1 NAD-dependent epimerase/dehydratase family protein [Streptococcus sp. zg-86]MTB91530.1 NAD-dependent epimerase/dehydratase family protein [Streptococcus sp. zg-36]MWV56775.1 NAD-dependent epimerase/dehydratase family protein [Streptococcus sp. zg-70]QTH48507.1 polysaccharide biosynthesis protein [Streptococcus sp. zg-86]
MRIDQLSRSTKRVILIIIDGIMLFMAMQFSLFFVNRFANVSDSQLVISYLIVLIAYLLIAAKLRIFSVLNRYTDYRVLFSLLVATSLSYLVLFMGAFALFQFYSYRFWLLSWLFSSLLFIFPRLSWRVLSEYQSSTKIKVQKKLRTLVVGAGSGGNLFINTVLSDMSDMDIIGIVDSDKNKQGTYIHGIKVLGNRADIPRLVKEYEVDQVTIAIPSLSGNERSHIVEICNSVGVKVNNMPSIEDVVAGKISTQQLRKIDIEDLLGRDEVKLDQSQLQYFFSKKTVLVTGAGGSIGSEICRQIARFSPERLLLLGHGENSIYLIHRELSNKYGSQFEIIPLIADIQDRELINEIMMTYQPHFVYHAAAHKHVPLMEYNPREAVKNNIFGTKNVAEAAGAAGVEKFVMISTDKAVNPPNVMGASKRIAEMIVTGLNGQGKTQFVAVRFGNVLGSRGSVVPVFKEQVAKGGPLTVTDFRMTRYFMTIPEASRLVIQAGYQARGGEIFILDMGEPVKIVDLAKKVITLSGHKEDEIKIIETGIRPGEKLYEELLTSDERVSEQIHEKIFVGRVVTKPWEDVMNFISHLNGYDTTTLKEKLIEFARQE